MNWENMVDNSLNMKFIVITQEMRDAADNLSKEMGKIKNSILDGEGNMYGFLGELIVSKYLNIPTSNSYDYDLIIPSTGIKADIKTKISDFFPKPDYDCPISAFNTRQKCDVYIFCRVNKKMEGGLILGYLPKEEYYEKAVKTLKGGFLHGSTRPAKADYYSVFIKELRNVDDLAVDKPKIFL